MPDRRLNRIDSGVENCIYRMFVTGGDSLRGEKLGGKHVRVSIHSLMWVKTSSSGNVINNKENFVTVEFLFRKNSTRGSSRDRKDEMVLAKVNNKNKNARFDGIPFRAHRGGN